MLYKTEQEWKLKKMRVKRKAKAHFHTREGVPLYNRLQVYKDILTYGRLLEIMGDPNWGK